jgi:acyl dehydratase
MPLQPQRLLNHRFDEIEQSYTARDAILYALGIGLGRDPGDGEDLNYLIEDRLAVVPSFAVTLASPGMWIAAAEFGVDFVKLVHAEQAAWFHAPLPPAADVIGRARVVSLADRGPERGAVLVLERTIHDGDGGFGGAPPKSAPAVIPDREPDSRAVVPVSPRAALIYRLSGDRNPLHADPAVARRAGFDRPILHGLASYAMAGVSVARACGHAPSHIGALQWRFSGVIFPGDAVEFRIWRDGDRAMFQAFVGERRVLDQGLVSFDGTP